MHTHRSLARFVRLLLPSLALPFCLGIATADSSRESGTVEIALPKPVLDGSISVERALSGRRSRREFAPEPLALASVSQLLWAAQGLTSDRGFRTAPSAGALYPLEIHLVAGAVSGLAPGVYRYEPDGHGLVPVATGDVRNSLARAAHRQGWMADAPAILALSAEYARTARKYGRRAPRYVHIEVGHAAQNVYLQAESLGLGTCMVAAFDDRSVRKRLGLPDELEPLGLMPVGRPR